MNSTPRIAAFFDLDRTLLLVNSGKLWLQRERRHGRLSLWQMIQATFYLIGYKFHAVDMERVMVKALQTVRGLDEEEVRRWTIRDIGITIVEYCVVDPLEPVPEEENFMMRNFYHRESRMLHLGPDRELRERTRP